MQLKDFFLHTGDLQVLAACVLYYMIPDMHSKVDVAKIVTWMKVCHCMYEFIPYVVNYKFPLIIWLAETLFLLTR